MRVCKETPTDITPRILAIVAKIRNGFGNCGPTTSLATNTSCTNSPANKSDTAGLKYRVLESFQGEQNYNISDRCHER